MTVKELIEQLQQFDPDREVFFEEDNLDMEDRVGLVKVDFVVDTNKCRYGYTEVKDIIVLL